MLICKKNTSLDAVVLLVCGYISFLISILLLYIAIYVFFLHVNLIHYLLTGISITGILSFINKTPVDWFSKKQSTVETATYGSDLVAERISVERMIDLRITLRYLGVPIREKDYMFGDN